MTYSKTYQARHRRGFTLFEVMTTLLLLGVLTVSAVSLLPSSNARLLTEADQLSSQIRYAQIRAQGDTYQWRLVFIDATTYRIGPVVITGPGFTPEIIPGSSTTQHTLADGVTTNSGTLIQFDSWGRPTNSGGDPFSSDQTITLTEGDQTRSITIRRQTGLVP